MESNKVVLSELENVFTSDNVIDLTSDDKAVLFTPPTRVSILLTLDVKPDNSEETLPAELDKVDTSKSIPSTLDDKVDTFDETVVVELDKLETLVSIPLTLDDKAVLFTLPTRASILLT